MIVFCGGMMRAGSTLQYQIASWVIETAGIGARHGWASPDHLAGTIAELEKKPTWHTLKTHLYTGAVAQALEAERAVALYVHRDLRDVLASSMLKHNLPFTNVWASDTLPEAVRNGHLWEKAPGVHATRYEALMDCPEMEVRAIADKLNVRLGAEAIAGILRACSLENNLARVSALPGGQQYDPGHLMHHRHIGAYRGEVGEYKRILKPEEIALVSAHYGAWLRNHGYTVG